MGYLKAVLIVCRFSGYFHLNGYIDYAGLNQTIKLLEEWPQNKPLPIITYRKFTKKPLPKPIKPLIPANHPGNGFAVFPLFEESSLTTDILGHGSRHILWAFEIRHNKTIEEARRVSDSLTRWLRGDVGWTKGPKPDVALHDILLGFQPKWRRKPLTPRHLPKAGSGGF